MAELVENLKFVKRTTLLTQVEIKWFSIQVRDLIDFRKVERHMASLWAFLFYKIPKEQTTDEPYKNYNVINKLRDYGRQLYEQDIINYESCRVFYEYMQVSSSSNLKSFLLV